jgi:hypothetical protein
MTATATRKRPSPKHTIDRAAPLALCPPSVRTMLVQVSEYPSNTGETEYNADLMPVIALVAERGEGGYAYFEPIVIEASMGALLTANQVECTNTTQRLVACPWDASEDAQCLAPTIRQLEAELRRQAQRKAASKVTTTASRN